MGRHDVALCHFGIGIQGKSAPKQCGRFPSVTRASPETPSPLLGRFSGSGRTNPPPSFHSSERSNPPACSPPLRRSLAYPLICTLGFPFVRSCTRESPALGVDHSFAQQVPDDRTARATRAMVDPRRRSVRLYRSRRRVSLAAPCASPGPAASRVMPLPALVILRPLRAFSPLLRCCSTRRLPRTRHRCPAVRGEGLFVPLQRAAKAAGLESSRFFSVFRTNSVANLSTLS